MNTYDDWRALPRTVWVLVVARTVNRLGAFTLPFLSVTLVSMGATVLQAGYLLAAFGLATIPSRLFGGRLADRLGARSTIVLGLVLTGAAQLALAASPTVLVAGIAVVLLGLAFEVYEPPSQALLADVTTERQRPSAYALMGASLAAAGVLAGLLAAAVAGVGLRWLFVVDAASCLACAAAVRLALPASRRLLATPHESAWRDRRLLAMLATGTVFAVVYLQITVALPLTVIDRGLPVGRTGLLLAVSAATMVVGQPLLRRLRGVGDFRAMAVGYVVLGVGLTATGLATTMLGMVLATVLWSLGDLVLLGRAYAVVAGLAEDGRRGGHLAAYGTSWGIAAVVAPLLGTRLLDLGGPPLAWASLGASCLVLALVQPSLARVVSGGTPRATSDPGAAPGGSGSDRREPDPASSPR